MSLHLLFYYGKKSSRSISPGCVGGITRLIVFGMAIGSLLNGNLFKSGQYSNQLIYMRYNIVVLWIIKHLDIFIDYSTIM